jgi:Ni/Fe-hydrogenase b-type cytochrome subunit
MSASRKPAPVRSALDRLPGTELVRTYVWEKPVRIAHWLIFFSFVSLSFTGLYIHRPFLIPTSPDSMLMARMRFAHELSGFVLIAAMALRVYWFFKGNRWARWPAYLPLRRRQWTGIGSMLEFYLFLRFRPRAAVGHNPLAALAYFVVYLLILLEIATGLVLFDRVLGSPALHQVVGWVTLYVDMAYVRLVHYFLTFVFYAFIIFHVYASVLVSIEEKNGLLDSIFSGWKFIPAGELRHEVARVPAAAPAAAPARETAAAPGRPVPASGGRRPGPGPVTLYRNWTSFIGTGIAAIGVVVFVVLTAYHVIGGGALVQPYGDLVLFIVPPMFVMLGVAVVLAGMFVQWLRWRRHKPLAFARYPKWDLNVSRERKALLAVALASGVLVGPATYGTGQAYVYTDSVPFCGAVCHAMRPQYVTYLQSAHARVECAACHIGPGVSGYVVAKTRGMGELAAMVTNDFPRPIPVTDMALRPARGNCEHCHWRDNRVTARHVRRTYSLSDEPNTPWELEMLVPIDGADAQAAGYRRGAHWHVAARVEYLARDTATIPWVRAVDPATGLSTVYALEGQSLTAAPDGTVRTMDCVDCHNRPSHRLTAPDESLDTALADGRVDRSLPFIKQQGVAALTASYTSRDEAASGIDRAIRGYYQQAYPQLYASHEPTVAAASTALRKIYESTIFPEMNARWSAYPTNDGHFTSPGCFRCHDGQHKSASGRVISSDCATCHRILRQGPPGSLKFATGPAGLDFEHPIDIGDAWKTTACSTCHTGGGM